MIQGVKKSSDEMLTPLPSGKQRQKKSGRGRPTASLIASVMTPVMSTENKSPEDTRTQFKKSRAGKNLKNQKSTERGT